MSQSTVLGVSEHCALVLRAPCSVSQSTVLGVSEHRALVLRALCSTIYAALSDETRFYETDDSRVTRRLLKEKSKLTFVDV